MNPIQEFSFCPPCRWFNRAIKNTSAAWQGRVYDLPLTQKERLGRGILAFGEYLFPMNYLVFLADKHLFHPCLTHKFKAGDIEDPAISHLQEIALHQLITPPPVGAPSEEDDEFMEVKEIVEEYSPMKQTRLIIQPQKKDSVSTLYIVIGLVAAAIFYWALHERETVPNIINTDIPAEPIPFSAKVIEVPIPGPPCPPPAVTKVYEKIIIPERIEVPVEPEKLDCPLAEPLPPLIIVEQLPAPSPILEEIEKIIYVNQTQSESRFYDIEDWNNRNEVLLGALFISAFIFCRR